jgi:hypothetical protein
MAPAGGKLAAPPRVSIKRRDVRSGDAGRRGVGPGRSCRRSEHQFVGPVLHDRIVGALELCWRRNEMLLIQNRRAGPTSD